MKWKRFWLEIYPYNLYVCAEPNPKKVMDKINDLGFSVLPKERAELFAEHDNAACTIRLYDADHFVSVLMYFRRLPTRNPTEIGHVAHECLHATNFIFMEAGVKTDPDNDEHQAYFLDYLIEKVLVYFWDYRETKR